MKDDPIRDAMVAAVKQEFDEIDAARGAPAAPIPPEILEALWGIMNSSGATAEQGTNSG